MVGNFLQRFVALVGLAGLRPVDVRRSDLAVMRTAIREGQAAFVETGPASLQPLDGKSVPSASALHHPANH